MCRQKLRDEVPEAGKPALSCLLNRALIHLLLGHKLLPRWNNQKHGMTPNQLQRRRAPVKSGRQRSYTNSRPRSTTQDRICLRWKTTPGGPCSSSCSAPRPVRAHMSRALSTSKEVSAPARYRALRIRFDPPAVSPPRGGTQTHFLPSTRQRDGARQSLNKRRRAPSFYLLRCYSHSHRLQQNETRCRPATSDA